jgi:hypothetical protein
MASDIRRRTYVRNQNSFLAIAAASAILMSIVGANAFDDAKYPDWKGQWTRVPVPNYRGQPPHDPSKPAGRGQEAPLTPEYQAIFEANLADQAAGGQGSGETSFCLPNGMPRVMTPYEPIEFIITPDTTYLLLGHIEHNRRIFTDGRAWPETIAPTYLGYSIGKWVDEDSDGRYNVLEVETRGFKGPRVYDATGIPLHEDNASIVKERISLDKANRNVMHNEITVIDHALTRPWTVTKNYRRDPNVKPDWGEYICAENNPHLRVGKEYYFVSGDGYLMPTRKGQAPPDARYFNPSPR